MSIYVSWKSYDQRDDSRKLFEYFNDIYKGVLYHSVKEEKITTGFGMSQNLYQYGRLKDHFVVDVQNGKKTFEDVLVEIEKMEGDIEEYYKCSNMKLLGENFTYEEYQNELKKVINEEEVK